MMTDGLDESISKGIGYSADDLENLPIANHSADIVISNPIVSISLTIKAVPISLSRHKKQFRIKKQLFGVNYVFITEKEDLDRALSHLRLSCENWSGGSVGRAQSNTVSSRPQPLGGF
jgi:hypothetical protein